MLTFFIKPKRRRSEDDYRRNMDFYLSDTYSVIQAIPYFLDIMVIICFPFLFIAFRQTALVFLRLCVITVIFELISKRCNSRYIYF